MSNQFFIAIKEVARNLFRKSSTVLFPEVHVNLPPDFRGAPQLTPNNCTLCKRCERVCPTTAISIETISKSEGYFRLDLGKCCYCRECQDTCNFNAIHLTDQWLTSELDRTKLRTEYHVIREPET